MSTFAQDFAHLVRSLQKPLYRRSGNFHRTRLLVTGQYIKTSNRKVRP